MAKRHFSNEPRLASGFYVALCGWMVPTVAELERDTNCKDCKRELDKLNAQPISQTITQAILPSFRPPLAQDVFGDAPWCTEAAQIDVSQKARFRSLSTALRWYADVALSSPAPSAAYAFNCLGDVNLEYDLMSGGILMQEAVRARIAAMRDKPWPFSKTNAAPTVAMVEQRADYAVEIEKAFKCAFFSEESRRGLTLEQCLQIVLLRTAGLFVPGKDERNRIDAAELAAVYNLSESEVNSMAKGAKIQVYVCLRKRGIVEKDGELGRRMARHDRGWDDLWQEQRHDCRLVRRDTPGTISRSNSVPHTGRTLEDPTL